MITIEPSIHLLTLSAFVTGPLAAATGAALDPAAQAAMIERGLRFLMSAYTIVWVILAIYMLSLSVRLRRISSQIRRLRERFGL